MKKNEFIKYLNNPSIKKLLELKENFAGGMSGTAGAPIAPIASSNIIIKNKYKIKHKGQKWRQLHGKTGTI